MKLAEVKNLFAVVANVKHNRLVLFKKVENLAHNKVVVKQGVEVSRARFKLARAERFVRATKLVKTALLQALWREVLKLFWVASGVVCVRAH